MRVGSELCDKNAVFDTTVACGVSGIVAQYIVA
jgi:hypothetical protein